MASQRKKKKIDSECEELDKSECTECKKCKKEEKIKDCDHSSDSEEEGKRKKK